MIRSVGAFLMLQYRSFAINQPLISHGARQLTVAANKAPQVMDAQGAVFDESLLAFLVCPLTKTPLRYDKQQQLLINDDLGVAYPIVSGVPHLIPRKGRILDNKG